MNLANQGEPLSLQLLEESSNLLGLAITYAVELLDIDTVVIAGGVVKMDWPLVEKINEAVNRYSNQSIPIRVIKSTLIDYSAIFGVTYQWIKNHEFRREEG